MEYKSKGYIFDEDVTAWLNELKAKYGSYNKGLRILRASVPFGEIKSESAVYSPVVEQKIRESLPAHLGGNASVQTFVRGPRPKGDKAR